MIPTGLFSLEEAVQWMKENQAQYADPKSKIKCVGVHITFDEKVCHAYSLDYRHVPNKHLASDWLYTVECFENHYLLPLNREKWSYDEKQDFIIMPEEFTYTPETAKIIAYVFVELDRIEGMVGRELMKLIHPKLAEYDNPEQSETFFISNAISQLYAINFDPMGDEPF